MKGDIPQCEMVVIIHSKKVLQQFAICDEQGQTLIEWDNARLTNPILMPRSQSIEQLRFVMIGRIFSVPDDGRQKKTRAAFEVWASKDRFCY